MSASHKKTLPDFIAKEEETLIALNTQYNRPECKALMSEYKSLVIIAKGMLEKKFTALELIDKFTCLLDIRDGVHPGSQVSDEAFPTLVKQNALNVITKKITEFNTKFARIHKPLVRSAPEGKEEKKEDKQTATVTQTNAEQLAEAYLRLGKHYITLAYRFRGIYTIRKILNETIDCFLLAEKLVKTTETAKALSEIYKDDCLTHHLFGDHVKNKELSVEWHNKYVERQEEAQRKKREVAEVKAVDTTITITPPTHQDILDPMDTTRIIDTTTFRLNRSNSSHNINLINAHSSENNGRVSRAINSSEITLPDSKRTGGAEFSPTDVLRITIIFFTGDKIAQDVSSSMTVLALLSSLPADYFGGAALLPGRQMLYKGKLLDEKTTLKENNVENNSDVFIRLRGY